MKEKSKLENPEKQAKTEVKDEALAEINGGGLGVGCDKNVASADLLPLDYMKASCSN